MVIREVKADSDAADKGLAAGDVITEANQQPIASVEDLETQIKAVREAGRKSILLMLRRGGEPQFAAISVAE